MLNRYLIVAYMGRVFVFWNFRGGALSVMSMFLFFSSCDNSFHFSGRGRGGGLPQLTTLLNTPLDILKVMLSLIRRVFYYMNGAIMKWTLYNVPVCKPGKIWRDWLARYECMETDFISIWCFCKEWNVLHKPLKLRKTWFSLAKLIADAIQSLQVLTQKLLLETKAKAIV